MDMVGDECPWQGWGWEMVRLGLVRLGYMGTFSCKPREIDEKFPNFFVVGLNDLMNLGLLNPTLFVGLNVQKTGWA